MKTVIAIDSFKGSMSSLEAANAAKNGILKADPEAEIIIKPLADGGEGTTEALIDGLGGEYVQLRVMGPLGTSVAARYGILSDGKTAVLEMAQAAGITLVPAEELNPHLATTYGVGEMICDALDRGCRSFLCGIGGSATTDGGAGMLQALGVQLLKADGTPIGPGIDELDQIAQIRTDGMRRELSECEFRVACDVGNPLCGTNGAVYIFGPQKGVKPQEREPLDRKMRHFAEMTTAHFGTDCSQIPGTGASGGLGFAFAAYLPQARLEPGISIVMDAIGIEKELKDADYCITGEGRLDAQTAMGKVPVGVAKLAKKYGVKVFAFAGSVTQDARACNDAGIDAFFPIVRGVTTLAEAMDPQTAKQNMTLSVEQVFRALR